MNVDEVLDTVEHSLLSRQLSSLERLILCQSWLGRGYSEMASDCAYSIAHIKEIGSQLWQALSKTLGERVTKKNLFLVLKKYLLYRTGETVNSDQLPVTFSLVEVIDPPLMPTTNSDQLPVTFSLVEVIDPPLTPTTNQLPVTTDFVEASYSGDSEQLSHLIERGELVNQEDEWLFRVQQKYQNSTDKEAENNLKATFTQSEPIFSATDFTIDQTISSVNLLFLATLLISLWITCFVIVSPYLRVKVFFFDEALAIRYEGSISLWQPS